jgi:phosphoglycerol transferase MdoB-like AlkP superfamily enzyme
MFLSFGDFSVISDRGKEIARMFGHGLRYDIRTAAIGLAPFTLIGIILIAWPKAAASYLKRLHTVLTFFFLVALVAAICNYFYYATYGSYFDVFIFGLIEEDTKAVLVTLWQDYPVLPFFMAIVLIGYVFGRGVKLMSERYFARPWRLWPIWLEASLVLFFLTGYGFSVHGSMGRYPLERRDAQVSSLKVLNMLTPNAVMALDWAISDHKKEQTYPKADNTEGQALFSTLYQRNVPLSDVSLQQFSDRTLKSRFLEAHPPHVVFAVMESLSTHLMTLDAPPANDMLGAWRPYWKHDFTFTRFLSDGNGTMESLARLLVASPVSSISQERAQRTPFTSNILTPYKLRGYRTLFITSGNGSWRNISTFLKELGFDEVVEQSDLIRKYPEAKLGTWGTYDEFSFRYAEKRLEEAEKKHEILFVMMLSITNHPPYTVPETFNKLPHTVDSKMVQRLSALSYPADSIIETFQYANDTIGQFIRRVEQKELGNHTVIAVTGDHNIRGVPYTDPSELALSHAVPFYLHVPVDYRRSLDLKYDPTRVGSHKDIMPTLYSLSLSDTPYYRRGVNLLAKTVTSPWYFGYNEEVAISEKGAFSLAAPHSFYPWADQSGLLVAKGSAIDSDHRTELDRFNAYKSIMNWQLNRQINRQP